MLKHWFSQIMCLVLLLTAEAELGAQTAIPLTPANIPANSVTQQSDAGPIYILKQGNYTATNTAFVRAVGGSLSASLDGELVLDAGRTLTATGDGIETATGNYNVGLAILHDSTGGTPYEEHLLLNGSNLVTNGINGGSGTIVVGSGVYGYGSLLNISAENGLSENQLSRGLRIVAGSFELERSRLNINASNNAVGLDAAYIELTGSEMYVTADGNNTRGAFLGTGGIANLGSLLVTTAKDGATGIDCAGYESRGGRLMLGAGDAASMIARDYVDFYAGSMLVVQFDATSIQTDGTAKLHGQLQASDVRFNNQATEISVNVLNSSAMKIGDSVTIPYLVKYGSDITASGGDFVPDDALRNFDLSLERTGDTWYLTATKTHDPSEFLRKTNKQFAIGLEQGVGSNQGVPGYGAASDLLSVIDSADSDKAMNDPLRRSSGWQAEKFQRVLMNNTDMRQNNLFNQLTQMRSDGIYDALAEGVLRGQAHGTRVNPWTRWFSWDGNSEHLGGESASYSDLRFDSCAFNVGMARRTVGLGRRAYVGLQFSYNYGQFRDDSNSVDRGYTKGRYDGFSALASARIDKAGRNYWTDWTLGWTVDTFDMNRRDYLGTLHSSDTTAGLFRLGWAIGQDYGFRTHKHYYYYEHCRLSPILGLDYSAISQGGLRENNNNGLALSGKDAWMNSLRSKLGLEFAYKYTDLALTMHSYLRYEFLDKGIDLPMSFVSAPAVRYHIVPQDVDRLSGVLGFNLTCQMFENQDVGFSYDGVFLDGGSSHWFNLRYVRRF